jgi:hypothetical protein
LPGALKKQLAAGKVNLDNPATTIALLKMNAVVGVTGFANPDSSVKSMGIQCALCHSTVDNSFAPGIGKRLDGWAQETLRRVSMNSPSPATRGLDRGFIVFRRMVDRRVKAWHRLG